MVCSGPELSRISLRYWTPLWRQWGGAGDGKPWHDRVLVAYREPHRFYHTTDHLAECLAGFDGLSAGSDHPHCVEIALWFHDIVYDPRSRSNETDSVEVFWKFAEELRLGADSIDAVRQLILRTEGHSLHDGDRDAAVMLDVDLAILGQSPAVYQNYCLNIRREYEWVPKAKFALSRLRIVAGFIGRSAIYHTSLFHQRFEKQARANLRAEEAALSALLP